MSTLSQPLAGKVALVTGGSRSIGAAIAQRLAADGASVAITYSASPVKAQEVVQAIERAGGQALALHADAGDPAAVRAAVTRTAEAFGSIDVLVNNAGIALGGAIDEIRFEDYERMIAVNVTGVFVATQEAVRHMKESLALRPLPRVTRTCRASGRTAHVALNTSAACPLRRQSWMSTGRARPPACITAAASVGGVCTEAPACTR
ncbi:SDR family NAD(P)-dependent oxidoreductase [Methylibium sp.]|jgi:NAD(P)-dependent dehydrogenase (short-subunit alcohol dehydrogenase family)|uniref:SDR family NAD(P)-dependent oxidoreductase n=1 Tax=Methylibium sp. TaxID=2067992 RepID=UPI003D0F97E6